MCIIRIQKNKNNNNHLSNGSEKRKEHNMKKLILTLALIAMTLAASANSARYFTRPQAIRVANTLDAQSELMIYCGYEYELATYVIINEVWAEPVNSKYYEIWLFGYDAYTGEEIYMPIDLSCIWLFNNIGNRMYSAAQYLRFRSTVKTPNFYWTMPPYNPFTRYYHDPAFRRTYTYHYEIHRYGWRPPAYPHHGPLPYHPYYMRTPHTPATVPHKPFTPGIDHPSGNEGYSYINTTRNSNTRPTTFNANGGVRNGNNRSNAGNPGVTNRVSSNSSNNSRSAAASATGNTGRGTTTNVSSSSRGNSDTGRGTTTNASSSSRGNSNNSRGTSTNTSTDNRGSSTNTRGTATSSSRGSSNSTPANNRGTSTNTRSNENSSKASSTQNSTRSSSSADTRNSSATTSRSSATNTTNSRGTSANTRSSSPSQPTNSRGSISRSNNENSNRGNSAGRR